jgi:hypothetical protein
MRRSLAWGGLWVVLVALLMAGCESARVAWYEKPYAQGDSTAELEMAMRAARREVRSLFSSP